jgi:hypothetical protein
MENVKKPKKLKALVPVEEEIPVQRSVRYIRLFSNENDEQPPKINFPFLNTIIPIQIKPSIVEMESLATFRKTAKISYDKTVNFEIDTNRNMLIVKNGFGQMKEYSLNMLSLESSRSGKSIDKKDAVELANVFLKLSIPPQNKKNVFIKSIRERIGLEN